MTILRKGSIFDIPHAFSHGLLKLIDESKDQVVDLSTLRASELQSDPEDAYITLQPRVLPLRRGNVYHVIPLQLGTHLKDFVTVGHRYRVELGTFNLNV